MAGDPNKRPRIFHGAFVEHGVEKRRVLVKFQFNPEDLTRTRSLSFRPPNEKRRRRTTLSLRDYHQREASLTDVRQRQQVEIAEETISFDLRLDATDGLGRGDQVAATYGIGPDLAALELMTLPQEKKKSAGKETDERGISFSRKAKPPLVLFVWGRRKVLPVNVTSLSVKETEFRHDLTPIRAVVSVRLTVIEGPNPPWLATYSSSLAAVRSARPDLELDEIDIPAQQAFG